MFLLTHSFWYNKSLVSPTVRVRVTLYVLVSSPLCGCLTRYCFHFKSLGLEFVVLSRWSAHSDGRPGLSFVSPVCSSSLQKRIKIFCILCLHIVPVGLDTWISDLLYYYWNFAIPYICLHAVGFRDLDLWKVIFRLQNDSAARDNYYIGYIYMIIIIILLNFWSNWTSYKINVKYY
jgi:hypothetical protein